MAEFIDPGFRSFAQEKYNMKYARAIDAWLDVDVCEQLYKRVRDERARMSLTTPIDLDTPDAIDDSVRSTFEQVYDQMRLWAEIDWYTYRVTQVMQFYAAELRKAEQPLPAAKPERELYYVYPPPALDMDDIETRRAAERKKGTQKRKNKNISVQKFL